MAKPLKIALLVISGLVLLLVAALIAAALLFDPNDYRGQIQEQVRKQTGREFALGDITLSVFPWLSVSVSDARLGNAAGFGEQPFAEIRKAKVGVQLLPLLFDKQVKVSAVALDGVRVNLAKNASGLSNWQDLIDHQEKAAAQPPKTEAESQFSPASIDIEGVTLDDSTVIYDDARSGAHYELQKLQLKTGALSPAAPFDVKLAAMMLSKAPAAQLELALGGTIKPDFKAQKLDTEGLELKLKGKVADLEIDTRLQTRLIADLAAQVFNLNTMALESDIAGTTLPNGKQTVKFDGNLLYNAREGAMRLQNGRLQAADLTLTTEIAGSGLSGAQPKFSGPITIAPFSPRTLLEAFGVKLNTADPKALTAASLRAQFSGDGNSASLQNLVVTLDQTRIDGRFSILDFKTQAMAFALKLNGIDADRYLPPKLKDQKKVQTPSGETKNLNDVQLPLEALNKLNAEGTIDLASLKVQNLKLSNIRIQLSGRGTQVKEQDLSARLYGGSLSLNHRYTPGATPAVALKTQLSSFQAAPFLLDFTGKDTVSGTADFSADLSARGLTVGALRRSLDGKLAAQAKNGAVKGFNLGAMVRRAQAALAGDPNYSEQSAPETDFTTISVSGIINKGILHSDDLSAASPLFRVGGSGDINLIDETLNYTARASVVETSKGQGGKALADLNGMTIPIRVTGDLRKPKYKVEISDAVRQKATEQIKYQLEQHKDEIKQKLDELLFGRKAKKTEPPPGTQGSP